MSPLSAPLCTVTADDRSMLCALARRILRVDSSDPMTTFRHPSNDRYWEVQRDVERMAERLAGYLTSGKLRIDVVAGSPRASGAVGHAAHAGDEGELEVQLRFDDGLDDIVVPWSDLDLTLVPTPNT